MYGLNLPKLSSIWYIFSPSMFPSFFIKKARLGILNLSFCRPFMEQSVYVLQFLLCDFFITPWPVPLCLVSPSLISSSFSHSHSTFILTSHLSCVPLSLLYESLLSFSFSTPTGHSPKQKPKPQSLILLTNPVICNCMPISLITCVLPDCVLYEQKNSVSRPQCQHIVFHTKCSANNCLVNDYLLEATHGFFFLTDSNMLLYVERVPFHCFFLAPLLKICWI